MSKIEYDPVKDRFAAIVRNSSILRTGFYFLLDLFFLRSWHIRRVLKTIGTGLDQTGTWMLLDAGCGFGQYDLFILNEFRNVRIRAVDVKKDYLEDNRRYFEEEIKKERIKFKQADLLQLSGQEEFDVILCVDVLEHIEEDIKVMKNLHQKLKPGGYFLMHSPSHYSEEDADGDASFVGEHARPGYSKKEISEKLENAGFSIRKAHYTYGFWGHKAWVLSIKWPMIWFNRIKLFTIIPLFLYYPIVMPFCLVMNFADLYTKNRNGTGIYALARKNA